MAADPQRDHDPPGPLGHVPVVLLTDPLLLDVVRAGVRRAGGDPPLRSAPGVELRTLRAAPPGAEETVIALCDATALVDAVNAVRELGGRAIPVLCLSDVGAAPRVSATSLSLLANASLRDLEIPVPAVDDDAMRSILWDQLRAARVEDRHHLVEVDGRPALEELAAEGTAPPADRWACLAAGAAGVLAGRIRASSRRWRAQLDA